MKLKSALRVLPVHVYISAGTVADPRGTVGDRPPPYEAERQVSFCSVQERILLIIHKLSHPDGGHLSLMWLIESRSN